MAYFITEECRGCRLCARICPVQAIHGEKGRLHTVDPQRCIDCGACGRVCPFAAVQNPHGQTAAQLPRGKWLKPHWDKNLCVNCNICVAACPTGVIALSPPLERIAYPYLASEPGCIGCSFCANVCPTAAVRMAALPDSAPARPTPPGAAAHE